MAKVGNLAFDGGEDVPLWVMTARSLIDQHFRRTAVSIFRVFNFLHAFVLYELVVIKVLLCYCVFLTLAPEETDI